MVSTPTYVTNHRMVVTPLVDYRILERVIDNTITVVLNSYEIMIHNDC